jgi:cytochrome c peroxidase
MKFGVIFIGLWTVLSCDHKSDSGFVTIPVADSIEIPDSIRYPSEFALKQAALGRYLFYDSNLSVDSTISCGSCHYQQAAFGDFVKNSRGVNGHTASRRNTPPLFNLYQRSSFFWDGGIPRLEQVAIAPFQSHLEMGLPLEKLTIRLNNSPFYVNKFQEVYQQQPDPYTITRSLAWFQRLLLSYNSPVDKFNAGDTVALSADVKAGWNIFNKSGCIVCHNGQEWSDFKFYNIGLETAAADTGRAQISYRWEDFGKFKTPSLRNLAFTAPYMHDGRFQDLDTVINYYNQGGSAHPLQNQSIKPLYLQKKEKEQLKAFLLALSDTVFIQHAAFSKPPFDSPD